MRLSSINHWLQVIFAASPVNTIHTQLLPSISKFRLFNGYNSLISESVQKPVITYLSITIIVMLRMNISILLIFGMQLALVLIAFLTFSDFCGSGAASSSKLYYNQDQLESNSEISTSFFERVSEFHMINSASASVDFESLNSIEKILTLKESMFQLRVSPPKTRTRNALL